MKYKFPVFLLMLILAGLVTACAAPTNSPARPTVAATSTANGQIQSSTPTISPEQKVNPVLTLGRATSGTPMYIGGEYMALGDSIAYGLGAPSPNTQGYTGTFYYTYLKRVRPDLLYFRSLGVAAETSTSFFDGDSRGLGESQYQRMLKTFETAATNGRIVSPITVTLGGNDMLEARNKSSAEKQAALEEFTLNFTRLLDELKARADPKATIFVTTYYNPYAVSTFGLDADTDWVIRFNKTISDLATARGMRLVDFFEPIFGKEAENTWINVGDIHPNKTGYTLLAQKLWQVSQYDQQAPSLNLTYNPVTVRPLAAGRQLAFKLAIQDNLAKSALEEITSAGSIVSVTAAVDGGTKTLLPYVPLRFRFEPLIPEYSYILNTSALAPGKHQVVFTATDSAGLSSTLSIDFELL
jgi:acyl-CoA thioesterase I